MATHDGRKGPRCPDAARIAGNTRFRAVLGLGAVRQRKTGQRHDRDGGSFGGLPDPGERCHVIVAGELVDLKVVVVMIESTVTWGT